MCLGQSRTVDRADASQAATCGVCRGRRQQRAVFGSPVARPAVQVTVPPGMHVVETRGQGIFRTEKPLPRIRLLSDRRRARVTHRALFFFLLRNRQIDIWSPVRLTLPKKVCFLGGDKPSWRSPEHERGGIRSIYIAFFSLGREGKKGSRLRRSLGSLLRFWVGRSGNRNQGDSKLDTSEQTQQTRAKSCR